MVSRGFCRRLKASAVGGWPPRAASSVRRSASSSCGVGMRMRQLPFASRTRDRVRVASDPDCSSRIETVSAAASVGSDQMRKVVRSITSNRFRTRSIRSVSGMVAASAPKSTASRALPQASWRPARARLQLTMNWRNASRGLLASSLTDLSGALARAPVHHSPVS